LGYLAATCLKVIIGVDPDPASGARQLTAEPAEAVRQLAVRPPARRAALPDQFARQSATAGERGISSGVWKVSADPWDATVLKSEISDGIQGCLSRLSGVFR
jgi:uncharacterized cupin superfamily protein